MSKRLKRARARALAEHTRRVGTARRLDFCRQENQRLIEALRAREAELAELGARNSGTLARLDAANRECSRLRDELADLRATPAEVPRHFLTPADLDRLVRTMPSSAPDTGQNAAVRPSVLAVALSTPHGPEHVALKRVSVRPLTPRAYNVLAYQLPAGIVVIREEATP